MVVNKENNKNSYGVKPLNILLKKDVSGTLFQIAPTGNKHTIKLFLEYVIHLKLTVF